MSLCKSHLFSFICQRELKQYSNFRSVRHKACWTSIKTEAKFDPLCAITSRHALRLICRQGAHSFTRPHRYITLCPHRMTRFVSSHSKPISNSCKGHSHEAMLAAAWHMSPKWKTFQLHITRIKQIVIHFLFISSMFQTTIIKLYRIRYKSKELIIMFLRHMKIFELWVKWRSTVETVI